MCVFVFLISCLVFKYLVFKEWVDFRPVAQGHWGLNPEPLCWESITLTTLDYPAPVVIIIINYLLTL